jgi:hypothetical protein
MARIRSVHPDLHRDKTLATVSASAERTFVRLWCHLDDEGRGEDDLDLLKADLYPRHRHIDATAIDRDLDELTQVGLVIRYRVRGERYLACKPETWARYQKPQKKQESKLPGIDQADPENDHSDTDTVPVQERLDTATEPLPLGGEGRGVGEEGSPPGGNVPFVRRLADELRQEHGCEFVEQETLYLAFQKLLQAALEHLPEQRHHATAMGVIAAFVERGQGLAMTRESRSHTARLVRTHPPQAVLNGFGQALHWGAGVDAKYATDPLSLSKYVAGVLAADRKGAA